VRKQLAGVLRGVGDRVDDSVGAGGQDACERVVVVAITDRDLDSGQVRRERSRRFVQARTVQPSASILRATAVPICPLTPITTPVRVMRRSRGGMTRSLGGIDGGASARGRPACQTRRVSARLPEWFVGGQALWVQKLDACPEK
jgi:hypothetical protein